MRRPARLLAAIAIGLMTVVTTALPASAYSVVTPHWMVCQPEQPAITGSLSGFANITYNVDLGIYRFEVKGWIKGCHAISSGEQYAVAAYAPQFGVTSTAWVSGFSLASSVGWIEINQPINAVCLLAAPNVRIDCIEVRWQGAQGAPIAGPHIATNSPLVNRPFPGEYIRMEWPAGPTIGPDPNCPSCWGSSPP